LLAQKVPKRRTTLQPARWCCFPNSSIFFRGTGAGLDTGLRTPPPENLKKGFFKGSGGGALREGFGVSLAHPRGGVPGGYPHPLRGWEYSGLRGVGNTPSPSREEAWWESQADPPHGGSGPVARGAVGPQRWKRSPDPTASNYGRVRSAVLCAPRPLLLSHPMEVVPNRLNPRVSLEAEKISRRTLRGILRTPPSP